MKLPDSVTMTCPLCGAHETAPVTYAPGLQANVISLRVDVAEDSSFAKHVLERHILGLGVDDPDAVVKVDPEAGPVVTDDAWRTHVVSHPVPPLDPTRPRSPGQMGQMAQMAQMAQMTGTRPDPTSGAESDTPPSSWSGSPAPSPSRPILPPPHRVPGEEITLEDEA